MSLLNKSVDVDVVNLKDKKGSVPDNSYAQNSNRYAKNVRQIEERNIDDTQLYNIRLE